MFAPRADRVLGPAFYVRVSQRGRAYEMDIRAYSRGFPELGFDWLACAGAVERSGTRNCIG